MVHLCFYGFCRECQVIPLPMPLLGLFVQQVTLKGEEMHLRNASCVIGLPLNRTEARLLLAVKVADSLNSGFLSGGTTYCTCSLRVDLWVILWHWGLREPAPLCWWHLFLLLLWESSFHVPDPGILCFLWESIKLWQANLLVHVCISVWIFLLLDLLPIITLI